MHQSLDVAYYLEVLRRRKTQFLTPAIVVFSLIVFMAFILPPVYKSTATILIEDQAIPQDLVQTTVTGFVDERLQSIAQVVLSNGNLLNIIKKFNLYPDLVGKYTTEEIIFKMREDIKFEPITAEVRNQYSGRPSSATIAFSLAYEGRRPQKVAQVANILTSLFLKENLKEREDKAKSTFNFLEHQLTELRSEIIELESKIAKFKESHVNELPELLVHNMNSMERLQNDMDKVLQQISSLKNRKVYLEGQLSTMDPNLRVISNEGIRFATSKEELEKLRREYITLTSKYSERYPDVISLKRQIALLDKKVNVVDNLDYIQREIKDKELELNVLSKKYSDKYPDVIVLKRQIDALKERLKESSQEDHFEPSPTVPDNPGFIQIQTQVTSTKLEIAEAERVYAGLGKKYLEYQQRVTDTPQVEQGYKILLRDYNNAQAKYQETNSRLMSAREAKGLEQSQLAEKFTLIDPPIVPEKPIRPNRILLVLVGFIIAFGVGIGVGSLFEFMDRSIRRSDELSEIVKLPILAVVPYWESPDEAKTTIHRKRFIIVSIFFAIVIALVAVHFLYMPLDIIGVKLFRKIVLNF
ncbi:lipopolysaccharide biosynthesis protein [Desulfovibrio sp. UCD-KL4C]|uniref:GumC family protein n=1 Tax=Desulfovibrio sp. UCD-KL4C TaxID=2578120 RepID=UPI0025BD18FD|nr:lipopolysaccharide biosynthesis protein [Desulfovibrio sp. UCD-KL4C]